MFYVKFTTFPKIVIFRKLLAINFKNKHKNNVFRWDNVAIQYRHSVLIIMLLFDNVARCVSSDTLTSAFDILH